MTAYSSTDLYYLELHNQVKDAAKEGYISKETAQNILHNHPLQLYIPNLFVKIGLGLVTIIIVLGTLGLLLLVTGISSAYGIFLLVVGLACYLSLEYITGTKKHYNSGVDNALLAFVLIFIISGLAIESHNAERLLSFAAFLLFAWLAIRFADVLMTILASLAALLFVFNVYIHLGEFTITGFPFILMATALLLFLFSKYLEKKVPVFFQLHCQALKVTGLFAFYGCGNVYIIQSIVHDAYLLQQFSPLNFAWLFWLWSFALPVVYCIAGISKKDLLLLRIGVITFIASAITLLYYFPIISAEVAMITGGFALVIVSVWLTRYLSKAKRGFVFEEKQSAPGDVEAYIIGEGFAGQSLPDDHRFGGGSFGGAGAGSKF